MDQFDIYVNVEGPSGNPGKRKTLGKCSQNVNADEDKIHILEPKRHEPALSAAVDSTRVKKSSLRAAAVILGLLCLLLLTGLITLPVMLTKSNEMHEMKIVRLQAGYNNLTEERNQLQTRYNQLLEDRKTLDSEARFKALTEERDELKTKLADITNYSQKGWMYFSGSVYYISSTTKTWQRSRDYCLQRGADLMIINSEEEQSFTRQLKNNLWIGLTDTETDGTWKWVDGTPLDTSYWMDGEPNNYKQKEEDCVEVRLHAEENNWNDSPCNLKLFWICEKKLLV
ncbi:CD209 antigen-like protein C [Sparus aurata]|uniref:CD209 antigen-like protein C n=1 Tax=Sparus aurata TaxID=8175 RepID=UPI0011C10B35|nr:CD209 antigen-like protein C [Sparus aurata]